MSIKHVLAPVLALADDEAALHAATAIAVQFGAKATALVVAVHPASEFAEAAAPLSEVLLDLAKGAEAIVPLERARILSWLERSPARFEVRDVLVRAAISEREAVAHAQLADVSVVARSARQSRARRMLLESFLFRAGRPVLLTPSAWRGQRIGERILIGWNAKREAVRAINDALPFLKAAREVAVATVDALPSASGHGQAPGMDLAAHLARHGVRVEVRNVDGMGRTEGRALVEEAAAVNADMIVMGAYGHSRSQEMLFGGVTRELLEDAPVPLFLSH
jgi:nucleotide-binding universal stress UspA family protein